MKSKLFFMVLWPCALALLASAVQSQATVILLSTSDTWRFSQVANLDGLGWYATAFDDSRWPTGKALLYVETNPTVSPRNTPLTIGQPTYYFRTHFNLPFPVTNATAMFSCYIDDGAVIYLNGREVQRIRMPAAPVNISYWTLATAAPLTGDAIMADNFVLSGTTLTNFNVGDNVLAVEVHQNLTNSDDIVFGASLSWAFTNTAPIILQHPQNVTVLDGRPASLYASVDGNPTPARQWYKDGQPLPGATGPSLMFAAVYPTNAGTYWLSASNAFGVTLSSNAVITVLDDTNPPTVLSAVASKTLTNVTVTFSEPVLAAAAMDTNSYVLFQTAVPSNHLDVLSAGSSGNSAVVLRTTARVPGINYTLRVNGVRDISSVTNLIAANTEIPLSYQVDLVPVAPMVAWRYSQAGVQPDTNWAGSSFDDSAWPLGAPVFAAGSPLPSADTVRTLLALTGTNVLQTYYFRTFFDLPGPIETNALRLHYIVDDGAIFYLNGAEAYSVGMPLARPVTYDTVAARSMATPAYEPALASAGYSLPTTNLLALRNCLAVEVHQNTNGPADASFAALLDTVITHYNPRPQLAVPAFVLEGAGVLSNQAAAFILEPCTSDIVFQLASSRPGDVGVPPFVTIPAGATNVSFDLAVGNDSLFNGPRSVSLSAVSPGLSTATAALSVLDDETNTIAMAMAATVNESDGTVPGEVRLAQPAAGAIFVALASSNTNKLAVPPGVYVPDGATSAVFLVSVIDNLLLDGPQTVTLTAAVPGWPAAMTTVIANDNEPTTITLQLPASVVEGAGVLTNAGKIQLAGIAVSNLNVTLSSSAPDRVLVATNLTLNAGQSNAPFDLTVLDNAVYEGPQSVTISASIPGFSSGANTLSVLENDAHHFAFGTIASPQYTNLSATITVIALDAAGQRQTNFNGSATLAANGLSGPVPLQPANIGPFTNGFWSGGVQCLAADRFVRLQTLGAPGLSEAFHVEGAPFRVVDVMAEDLIWDPGRQRLYASVPDAGGVYSNSITAIDPWTGAIIFSVPVGPIVHPAGYVKFRSGKMAIADNGQYLYVSVSNALAVQRVALATPAVGPAFAVGTGMGVGALSVADLVVLPGSPQSVAVARADGYNAHGVAIYDNGIQRANSTPEYGAASINALEPSPSSSMLLGCNNQSTGFQLTRIAVDASGASVLDSTSGLLEGFSADIVYRGGLLFGSWGAVVDPGTLSLVGRFNVESSAACCKYVAPDPAIGRAFFLSPMGPNPHLQGHDLATFLPLKSFDFVADGSGAIGLVRWGTNGLALNSPAGKIYLVQSSLLFPQGQPANLAVSQVNDPPNALIGTNLTITVTVTNAGPEAAMEVTLTNTLPAGVTLISSAVSQGTCSNSAAGVNCRFGMIPAGTNAMLTLVVRAECGGWLTNRAVAIANERDTDLTDNISTAVAFVGFANAPDTARQIKLPSWDLVYAPNTGRLYVSTPASGGGIGGSIVPVDPHSGTLGAPLLPGEDPRRLALASDAQYLYAATEANHNLRRIDLPTGTPGLAFALQPGNTNMVLEDLEALPDQPGALVVLRSPNGFDAEVAVYDDGVARTNVAAAGSDYYSEILEVADGMPLAFVQNYGVRGFWRYAIDSTGVKLLDTDTTLNPLLTTVDLEWGNGLLYTSFGLVIDPVYRVVLGQIPAITSYSLVTYDKVARRLFYLTPNGTTNVIRAIDPITWAVLGTMTVTNCAGSPAGFIRWGADGFAFRTTADQLFIIRSSIVPSGPSADLEVTGTVSTNLVPVNSDFTYTILVTNAGPNTASNVVVFHRLPPAATYVSSSSSAGLLSYTNGLVACRIGTLVVGGSEAVQITARTSVGGILDSLASVVSDALDSNAGNDLVHLSIQAVLNLTPDSCGQVAMNVRDIAYNPFDGRLYASGNSNRIYLLDPLTGRAEAAWPLPVSPGFLRLTRDGAALYCVIDAATRVVRITTGSGAVDLDLPIGFAVNDLEPMPGVPNTFVLSRSWEYGGVVQVYDGVVPRPAATDDSAGARDLEFGAGTNVVYAVGSALSSSSRYRIMTVLSNGIAESGWNESLPPGLGKLHYDSGRLYAGTGEILDPLTGTVASRFAGPGPGSLVAPDVARGRVFFLNQTNTTWRVQAYDPATLGLLGSITVSNVSGTPRNLVRCGEDGLAFCTSSNQLFLLRSSLVPAGAASDLVLGHTAGPAWVAVGGDATLVLRVTNVGPAAASNVMLVGRVPTNAMVVQTVLSQGTAVVAGDLITCSLGTLADGASAQLTITLRPTQAGALLEQFTATSANTDPDLGNNSVTVGVGVRLDLAPDSVGAIGLQTADIQYDPVSGLIYASATNYFEEPYQNAVVPIDPATGLFGSPLLIGPNLSTLAISSDGSRLSALADGGFEFRQVDLPQGSNQQRVRFSEPGDPNPRWSEVLKAVPGLPGSVVVVLQRPDVLLGSPTVTVYDGATARSAVVSTRTVEFYSPDHLIGFDWRVVPNQCLRLAMAPNGVVAEMQAGFGVDGDMVGEAGVIYTSGGSAFDPAARARICSFGVTGPVAPDAGVDRVAFLTGSGSTQVLRVFDTHNLLEWGSVTISNIVGTSSRLIRCGADRFAFRTSGGQVFIVRSSAIAGGNPAQLALGVSPTDLVATVGQPLELVYTVSNAGPGVATGILVSNALPAATTLSSALATHGATTADGRELRWQVASLGPGEAATNRVTLVPGQGGLFAGLAVLRSESKDTNSLDNVVRLTWRINNLPGTSALSQMTLRASDMVWESVSQQLLLSLPADAPGFSNSVVALDPLTGMLQTPIPVGPAPGKLAVSDNGQYLYVGLNATASVTRVALATKMVDITFPLNTGYQARDMAVIPGQPGTVAVAREYFPDAVTGTGQAAGVALYRDGTQLPLSTPPYIECSTAITCSTNTARLYGYNGWTSEAGFRRYDVSANGLTQVSATPGLISGFDRKLEFAAGLLYASSGAVLQPEALAVVTNIPDISAGALCKADIAAGLLSFVTRKAGDWVLRQYAHSNYALLRELRIPALVGQPRSLTRWGTDGLAFLTTSNQLYLFRPSLASVDLSIRHASWPTQALAGQTLQVSLSVSNVGPSFEPDAIVTNTLPGQTVLLAAQASQGTVAIASNRVLFFLGSMAPNATANLTLTLQPTNTANATVTNSAVVTGAFIDAVSNNLAAVAISLKADTDRDGLPDDWEVAHGLRPDDASDAALDPDGDGKSNLEEYLAGTDPMVFDGLRIVSARIVTSGMLELTVHAALGKAYALQVSTNLVQWSALKKFTCSESSQTVAVPFSPGEPNAFYRLQALGSP